MEEEKQNQTLNVEQRWGTWEELLLACAVKRHGFKDWESVSMEIQTRTSLPHILTSAHNCQQKYHDLHRRFSTHSNDVVAPEEDNNNNHANDNDNDSKVPINIPWLEELRKLRVAELKQEVHRYDISIHSLQLKVKRLEEEREKSLQLDPNDGVRPDLQQDASNNDKKDEEPQKKDLVSGDESDRENRSVNESNSACSEEKKGGAEPVLDGSGEAAPVLSVSNSKQFCGGEESHELGDSVTQLSSEVQSSASLGVKRKRKIRKRREEMGGGDGIKGITIKSEPLTSLIDIIRAHKYGPLFEGPFENQETDLYRNMIRQHLDLETIQTKLEQGHYSPSNLLFYRDLLLLFNNAIVFFAKSSNEWAAAYELRSLVSNEMKRETKKSELTAVALDVPPQPKIELEGSDSLLAKHKASAPIVVCRKWGSSSAKPSPSSFGQKTEQQQQQQQQQSNANDSPNNLKPSAAEQSSLKIESKEKHVTGTRSSRKSQKNVAKGATSPSKKQNASPATKAGAADKPETPKTEKKKPEALALDKKRSAADFLKRIKKNSPVETGKKNTRGSVSSISERKKENNSIGKGEKGKERVLRRNDDEKHVEESSPSKRNVGRPAKKGAEVSKVSGKRGRESSGKEAAKRPKKRSRR